MPKIILSNHVKTRAKHCCYGCGREFPKGAEMDRQSCRSDNNELFILYLCPTCEAVIDQNLEDNEPYEYGQFYEESLAYEARS